MSEVLIGRSRSRGRHAKTLGSRLGLALAYEFEGRVWDGPHVIEIPRPEGRAGQGRGSGFQFVAGLVWMRWARQCPRMVSCYIVYIFVCACACACVCFIKQETKACLSFSFSSSSSSVLVVVQHRWMVHSKGLGVSALIHVDMGYVERGRGCVC